MSLKYNYDSSKKNIELLKYVLTTLTYCDTLGFSNGDWEFNFNMVTNSMEQFFLITNNIIEEYIFMGGPDINIKNWNASDDTILSIVTVQGIINKNYRNELINSFEILDQDIRSSGFNTLKSILWISKNTKDFLPYNNSAGGNGAAIRTAPIGILFKHIKNIILHSFINSIQTHNQVLGFLGGIATAVITYFAKNNITPFKWFEELIKLEPIIDNIIENSDYPDKKKYKKEKYTFWNKIKDYQEFRVSKLLKKHDLFKFITRYKYLLRLLRPNYENSRNNVYLGASGLEVIILSYDSILLSTDIETNEINFNKLIYYGVLHFGDNDSTGAIVGAWYSAYHKIIHHNIKPEQLEFNKQINDIIQKL